MTEQKGNSATRAKRKYNSANYERIALDVRKGMKEEYKRAAEACGMSISAYVQEAVKEKMERDKAKTTEA